MKNISCIMIVDDDSAQCFYWKKILEYRYRKKIEVITFTHPEEALDRLDSTIAFVLLDWHMPTMDGKNFLSQAKLKGLGAEHFIIFSGTEADTLHEVFPAGNCLAVIEKGSPDQEEILLKILDEVVKVSSKEKKQ